MIYTIESNSVGADDKHIILTVHDNLDSVEVTIDDSKAGESMTIAISTDILKKLDKLIAIKEQQ